MVCVAVADMVLERSDVLISPENRIEGSIGGKQSGWAAEQYALLLL